MSSEPLIYTPAKRGNVGLLIMLSGPSGSGKTKSALRLATGLACGGEIDFCDTEHGRALYYADEFKFNHLELHEPFNPARFEAAAVISQRRKSSVLVIDSFSHEHVGPGGVLDMFEAELQRMAGGDYEKRERVKMAAWIKPKAERNHMMQRLWQLNTHIVLCCQAAKKVDLIKDPKTGKIKPVDIGFLPVCGERDVIGAMTVGFMFDLARPGVPTWLKKLDQIEPLIDMNKPIDEATGERLAAWARGKRKPESRREATVSTDPPSGDNTPALPPAAESNPVDDKGNLQKAQTAPPDKDRDGARKLIAMFKATKSMADHFKIMDQKKHRDDIDYLVKERPDLAGEVIKARDESAKRGKAEQNAKPRNGQPEAGPLI